METSNEAETLNEVAINLNPERLEEQNKLLIRKKCEREIIQQFDRTTILLGRDCWYLIDTDWLQAWSRWVFGEYDEPPPGPVTSKNLLDDTGNPLKNLVAKIDYRGVSPLVFYLFVELHGKDTNYPDICRYAIDIYKPAVPVENLVNISYRAINKAKLKVNKIRPKWMVWEREYPEEEEEEAPTCWCCGLTKEHLEAFIYWAVTCWSRLNRKKSGRSNIKYSDYKPLRNNNETEAEDSVGGGEGKEGSGSAGGSSGGGQDVPKEKKMSYFTKVKNNLTNMMSRKGKSGGSGGGSGGGKSARKPIVRTQAEEDEIDESEDDYEGIAYGRADRGHERGQWASSAISSTVQGMNRG